MRFQCYKIEKFIAETLQILFLTTILGCPFSGYQQQTTAMKTAAAKDYLPGSITAAALAAQTNTTTSTQAIATKVTLLLKHNSSLSLLSPAALSPTAAHSAALKFEHSTLSPTLTTLFATSSASLTAAAAVAASAPASLPSSASSSAAIAAPQHPSLSSSLSLGHRALSQSNIYPPSDILNGSNEIDSNEAATFAEEVDTNVTDGDDDAKDDSNMTEQIASYAATKHFNSKSKDLSAFSLLSFNDSTAASLTLSHSGSSNSSNSNNNDNYSRHSKNIADSSHATAATFLQIKSQKHALKSTAAVAAAAAATETATTRATASAAAGSHQHNKHNSKSSRDKVESKFILPKPQKTDAPMLNYIFDTFQTANKHHHHDQRYGPHFEDVQRVGQPTNITVQAGGSVYLNCRISLLQDKTVSWVRRNAQGEHALDLLTVGLHTYTGEKRYTMEFQYPNNWRLKIMNVRKDDEAMYECQISTHPPRVIQINLHVNAPKVMIVDEVGDPLQEKYYEIDSTLQLSCIVRNVAMSSAVVFWKHGEQILNYDITRGGVSVKTELMEDGANSTLFIAKINKSDSGNYSCSISDTQEFNIVVHILNGESFAELHHGIAAQLTRDATLVFNLTLILFIFSFSAYFNR